MSLAASAFACSPGLPVKPNILIFITDQQSYEAMSSVIGNRYINTPNMDYLAEHGVSFTNAYCPNPLSIPSRSSMFTGRYPHETGIQFNDNQKRIDPAQFPCMGSIFSDAGYETGYVGKWHLPYNQKDKDSHGFDFMKNIKNNGIDSLLAESAIEFLEAKHEKPFLLVASFINPHNICEWARGQELPDGKIGLPPDVADCPPLRANALPSTNETDIMKLLRLSYQASPMFPVSGFSDDKWRQYTWAYYRMIEKTDRELGKIIEVLRKSGIESNTIIVFLSDHGDCQGAHRWNQKTVFYQEASNIPLIISNPLIKSGKSDYLVQTGIDLLPTICDIAGIKVNGRLPGISLRPLLEGRLPEGDRKFVVVSDMLVQGDTVGGHKPEPEGRMLRNYRFKYWIMNEGKQRETLYDLINDPGEMVNIAENPEYKKHLDECRKDLREWARENSDPYLKYLK